ncbi:MAG: ImmA/IrrE family metallo-endopeptidase [Spirochaetales bacterium]|jgi:Zn-dependent peptidase ImmA (M78 family)|nr:ImmA/IrrE family metallo-endopeptidase [Spirochaetales bacterium]
MMEPNYKYARDMAKQILKKHKINSVPTDLQIICERLGLEFVELDDPNESDGAVIEMEGGLRVAMLNKAKPFVRARFTLAHELGHIFLNHDKREFYDPEVSREWGEDAPENAKPAKEREADAFASELLIPMEQLKKYQGDLNDLDKLIGLFKVSKPAMSIAVTNFFSSSRNFK